MKARLAAVFVLLWALLGAHAPVQAQESTEGAVSLQVSIGLDGYYRYQDWVRVWVVAENTGAAVEEVLLESDKASPYTLRFALPPGARKSFEVYQRLESISSGSTVFTLQDARTGQRLARSKTPSTLVGEDELLVGVWSARIEMATLFAPPPGGRAAVRYAFLSAADLPARPLGYEALNALVIGPESNAALLSEAQRHALRQWVLGGGRLVILGGGAWTNARPLEAMLPLIPAGAAPSRGILLPDGAPAAEALVAVQGALRPDARLLSGTPQQPAVLARPFGNGRVLYTTFDPNILPQERLRPVFDALWAWSGAQEAPAPAFGLRDLSSAAAYRVLHQLKQVLPPLGTLALLVLLYPLVLGPIHYRLMRSRSQWMWGSTLLISMLFSGMWIAWGQFANQKSIVNRWYAVQSWEGEAQARVDGLVGLYSSAPGTHTYQTDEPWQAAPLQDTPYQDSTQPDFTVQYTPDGVVLPKVRMGAASMAHLAVSGEMHAPGFQSNLQSLVQSGTLSLTGTFLWNEVFSLSNVALLAPGGPYPLGDITPGVNHVDIPLHAEGQISDEQGAVLRESDNLPGGPPLSLGVNAPPAFLPSFSETENAFLSAIGGEAPLPPSGRVLLMGWANDLHLTPPPWQADGSALPVTGKVLYVFNLPLDNTQTWQPGSRFSLGAQLSPDFPAYLCSKATDKCPATLLARFALPIPPPAGGGIRASLFLTVSTSNTASLPGVDIWNPQSQTYEPLPAAKHISLSQAETYLSPQGTFFFRLSHPGGSAQDMYLRSFKARLDVEIRP